MSQVKLSDNFFSEQIEGLMLEALNKNTNLNQNYNRELHTQKDDLKNKNRDENNGETHKHVF